MATETEPMTTDTRPRAQHDVPMTADDAIQALRDAEGFRRSRTARAVAMVWVIWGMALAIYALLDVFNVATQALTAVDPSGQNGGYDEYDFGIYTRYIGIIGTALAFAAVTATYMVWQGHALAVGPPKDLPAMARGLGQYLLMLAAVVVVSFVLDVVILDGIFGLDGFGNPPAGTALPIWSVMVAATITYATRKDVGVWPGIIAAGVMIALGHVTEALFDGGVLTANGLANTAGTQAAAVLATFTAVGLWIFRRG